MYKKTRASGSTARAGKNELVDVRQEAGDAPNHRDEQGVDDPDPMEAVDFQKQGITGEKTRAEDC